MLFDTIVAPITGAPPAGVAIIRVSGPQSWPIAQSVFSPWPENPEPRRALFGRYVTGEHGLALPFRAPQSFTGEDTVEMNIHGSRAGIESLLNACIDAGARMARPGEFSERAFLNGKIDLTQAESIRDMIEAVTDAQLRQASLLQDGALTARLALLRQQIESVLANIEARVDFAEEVGELDKPQTIVSLQIARNLAQELLATAEPGRFLRSGIRIVLAGRPNAGKSSLLNALLGSDRAIVSPTPGTTRDYVEEQTEIGGIVATLVDTAGLRETHEAIEQEGINRTRRLAESCDAVWLLYDLAVGWTDEDEAIQAAMVRPVLRVGTKADLVPPTDLRPEEVAVSVQLPKTLQLLSDWIGRFTGLAEKRSEPLIRPRHRVHLQHVSSHVDTAIDTLSQPLPYDLASVSLQSALAEIRAITGESADPQWVESIFREFCIGK